MKKFEPDYDQDYLNQVMKFYDQLLEERDTHDWEVIENPQYKCRWQCRCCGLVTTSSWKCARTCSAHLMQEALD